MRPEGGKCNTKEVLLSVINFFDFYSIELFKGILQLLPVNSPSWITSPTERQII